MDDPTRRFENDTDNGTRLLGAPSRNREQKESFPLFRANSNVKAQKTPLAMDLALIRRPSKWS
jgi:hypothetical protein